MAEQQLQAYNARDVDRFVSQFSPDVQVLDFPSQKMKLKGRAAFKKRYQEMFEKSPKLHCRILNRTVQGAYVIDQELVAGIHGREGELQVVSIYEIHDGLIERVWFLPL